MLKSILTRFTSIWGWSRETVVAFWLVVVSLLSFLQINLEQWKLIIGIIANINTFFFYGAPLSTIVTVLKTRDSWQVYNLRSDYSMRSISPISHIVSSLQLDTQANDDD
jgi:hypothetical protein